VDFTSERIHEVLKELIKIPSPYFQEQAITEYVYQFMKNTGISTFRQKVAEAQLQDYEGENIIGFLDAGKEKTIMINAHMDTVYPSSDWKTDPYKPYVSGDEMVGLGAADMKGGLAVMLLLAEYLMNQLKEGITPNYNVILLASVDEEGPDSLGARIFLKDKLAKRVDYALVLESGQGLTRGEAAFPSVIHRSLGCYLYLITVTGQSAHAADPEAGANAIDTMGKVIEALKKVELEKSEGFSRPVSNVLWIKGGEKALSTPEKCELLVDFHVTPEENHEKLRQQISETIKALKLSVRTEVDFWRNGKGEPILYPPYDWDFNHPLTEALSKSCRNITGQLGENAPASICVGDFNHFSDAGIPTVILGPDGHHLHAGGEAVNLKDLEDLTAVLADFLLIG